MGPADSADQGVREDQEALEVRAVLGDQAAHWAGFRPAAGAESPADWVRGDSALADLVRVDSGQADSVRAG